MGGVGVEGWGSHPSSLQPGPLGAGGRGGGGGRGSTQAGFVGLSSCLAGRHAVADCHKLFFVTGSPSSQTLA